MIYDSTLQTPGEFFNVSELLQTHSDVITGLRKAMSHVRPTETAWHTIKKIFVHPDLAKCTHVFVRNDSVRPSLSHPFDGPFRIIEKRQSKYFTLNINGRTSNVSHDRLKPAYLT